MRNAISRSRVSSTSKSTSVVSKMSASGLNVTVVPRSVVASPRVSSVVGSPRAKLCVQTKPSWRTSTVSHSERALTTETPTPCRPPETL